MAADLQERIAFELAATPEAASAARRTLLAGNSALPSSVRDDVLQTGRVRRLGPLPRRSNRRSLGRRADGDRNVRVV